MFRVGLWRSMCVKRSILGATRTTAEVRRLFLLRLLTRGALRPSPRRQKLIVEKKKKECYTKNNPPSRAYTTQHEHFAKEKKKIYIYIHVKSRRFWV